MEEFAARLQERAAAAVAAETSAHVPRRCETRVRTTARVRAGRELYAKLQEVGRLQHDHKAKQAAELFAQLHAPPAPTDEKAEAREDGLARRRACELRDFTFSFGGLSLTRQVLQRLLEMREVSSLLFCMYMQGHKYPPSHLLPLTYAGQDVTAGVTAGEAAQCR